MNEITHFLTGMLIARLMKKSNEGNRYKHDEFPTLFAGFSALIPDIYEILTPGIAHATWTHTLLFTLILAFSHSIIIWLLGNSFFKKIKFSFKQILRLAFLGAMSHLILDIGTYYGDIGENACVGTIAHVYFWPIWDQSFHLDCLFGATSAMYVARVIIEWAIYTPILAILLVYRWKKHGESIFHVFCWRYWFKHVEGEDFPSQAKKQKIRIALFWTFTCFPILTFSIGIDIPIAGIVVMFMVIYYDRNFEK